MEFEQLDTSPEYEAIQQQVGPTPKKKQVQTKLGIPNKIRMTSIVNFVIYLIVFGVVIFLSINIISKNAKLAELEQIKLKTQTQLMQAKTTEEKTSLEYNNTSNYYDQLYKLKEELIKDEENLTNEKKRLEDMYETTSYSYEGVYTDYLRKKENVQKLKEEIDKQEKVLSKLDSEYNYLQTENERLQNELRKIEELYSPSRSLSQTDSFSSIILTQYHRQLLYDMLNSSVFPLKRAGSVHFKLLYRSSMHGLSAKTFHELCDDDSITNTLIIIQSTNGEIFGGFTRNNWGFKGFKRDRNAFLFNLNKELKYYPDNDVDKAVFGGSNLLCVFGDGDLIVYETVCYSHFPNTYTLNDISLNKYELTGGHQLFTISEMEVFTIEVN